MRAPALQSMVAPRRESEQEVEATPERGEKETEREEQVWTDASSVPQI